MKAFIVGVDGLCLDRIFKDTRSLNLLSEIYEKGRHGVLLECERHSFAAWASFLTGLPVSSVDAQANLREWKFLRKQDLKQGTDQFMWETLSNNGLSVGVVDFFYALPEDFVSLNGWILPNKIYTDLDQYRLNSFKDDPNPHDEAEAKCFSDYLRRNAELALDICRRDFQKVVDRIEERMKNHPVDVLMFYTDRVDQVYHFCRERADGDLITTAHLELDRLLEKLVKQYSPENIVVFSDHGNVPITKFVGYKEQLFKAQFSEEKQEYYNQVRPIFWDGEAVFRGLHDYWTTSVHASNGVYFAQGPRVGNELPVTAADMHGFVMDIIGCKPLSPQPHRVEQYWWQSMRLHEHFIVRGEIPYEVMHARWALIRKFLPRGDDWRKYSLVDVGCNNGFYCFEAARRGARTVGVDVERKYLQTAEIARRYLGLDVSFIQKSAEEELPITADIVLCMGVLHHCPDPFAVIKALGKAAAPRARLILETITVKSKETVMMRGHQGDEWYFSESAMKQILNKYGNFTVAEVVYTGLDSLNRMRTFFFARHGIDADSLSKLSEEEDRGSTSSFSLPIPDPPPLVSPIDGASDVDLRPTFKWRTISDVDFYWLHVVDETEGEKTILEVAIYPPTTEYSSQKSLDKGHTYRWAVYTHNPNGFSSLGEVRRFTT